MRLLILVVSFVSAVGYGVGAVYFWTHERRAQSLELARAVPHEELAHPEATLALVRDVMASNDFSPRTGALVKHSLTQVPAFYQPPLHLAVYHTNRLEESERTRLAFQAALRRFPANGQLHLDYARWLLMRGDQGAGEEQIRIALELEPTLARTALKTLRQRRVPSDRWIAIVPDVLSAQRELVIALLWNRESEEALAVLRTLIPRYDDARDYRRAAEWALRWGDPALALTAVQHATGLDPHETGLFEARAHLALGDAELAYEIFRDTLQKVGPSSRSGLKLLCGMGNVYLRLKRVILAESVFTEAVSYAPNYADALLGLARTHRSAGRRDKAIAHYDRLLRVEPEHEHAQRELELLLRRSAR